MTGRLRSMLAARQNAILAAAQMGLINLGNQNLGLQQQLAKMSQERSAPSTPVEDGPSMARQIMENYMGQQARTILDDFGDNGALMAPMIRSVMQLDR